MNWLTRFWDWVDSRKIVRRLVLFIVLWMTWRVTDWAFQFAHEAVGKGSGAEAAAIIIAITAPFAALQAFIFKWYSGSRTES